MDDAVVPAEQSVIAEQPGRRDTVSGQAGVVLGDLLRQVDVERQSGLDGGPPLRQMVGRHGAHRVHRGAHDDPGVAGGAGGRQVGEPVAHASAEASA